MKKTVLTAEKRRETRCLGVSPRPLRFITCQTEISEDRKLRDREMKTGLTTKDTKHAKQKTAKKRTAPFCITNARLPHRLLSVCIRPGAPGSVARSFPPSRPFLSCVSVFRGSSRPSSAVDPIQPQALSDYSGDVQVLDRGRPEKFGRFVMTPRHLRE